ncbi:hypothetical protein PCANC_07919 [Puccinia coronata f. sp. avenae]|uniref:Uncharacterized protein n=1 Tax=Puccinia coronata f. sp. avenae TaxID=200324 RepID=A0A2N5UYA5_9BASI|nr:hypothetical protein PCANC_07919 [Puccinia coronata f. sp. avenae]
MLKFSCIEEFKPPATHLRPETWSQDNTAVCSVITQTVDSLNYHHICDFKDDAAGMWAALKAAHKDSSSGGQMYWLRKLIQSHMTGDNVDSHLKKLGGYAEKLNALITTKNPLTAGDVFSMAILISLPSNWLHCVSAMMNKEQVPSLRVITALKAESLCQKSCRDQLEPVAVAKDEVSAAAAVDKSNLLCTFCNQNGHDLTMCNNANKILKDAKVKRQQEFQSCQGGDSSLSKPKSDF